MVSESRVPCFVGVWGDKAGKWVQVLDSAAQEESGRWGSVFVYKDLFVETRLSEL